MKAAELAYATTVINMDLTDESSALAEAGDDAQPTEEGSSEATAVEE